MVVCASCGAENRAGARYCDACGRPLAEGPSAGREVRKTVTVLFVDVVRSTELGEQLDAESLRSVMARYFAVARHALERHGGTVEKFIGDAVMAVFGIPVLHEDDALRAVRAALELRHALEELNEELARGHGIRLAVRTGINTGEVVAGDAHAGHALVTGEPVQLAARLQEVASAGQILIGAETLHLVRDFVETTPTEPLALKGKAAPVRAYVLENVTGTGDRRRPVGARMVGRDRELGLLRATYERSVMERTPQLFTLLGAAGVGKSRLAAEFLIRIAPDATALRGRCLPYGEGITYWPLAQAIRDAAGVSGTQGADGVSAQLQQMLDGAHDAAVVRARIEALLAVRDDPVTQEELFTAARRLLETVAARGPLVVLFEDIHWAEDTFLDLVEQVADLTRDAPLLLLCTARPELLDSRRTWGGGKFNATSLLLEPLPRPDADTLLTELLHGRTLPESIRQRLSDAAEGNPLFVEELVGMLVDTGLLALQDGRWVPNGALESVPIPPSIQALLAARIDRLEPDERAVAERASVVGRGFSEPAAIALASEALKPRVTRVLMDLVRKELLRVDASVGTERSFRFRHILIRDAAYDSLPKLERADLHETCAGWLAQARPATETDELAGYHLEQAYRYRRELARLDDRAVEVGARAAAHLAAAGSRARDRGDVAATVNLLRRALALVPANDRTRPRVALELSEALFRAGDMELARALSDEAIATAATVGDEPVEAAARVVRLHVLHHVAPDDFLADVERDVPPLIAALEARNDPAGLARAWRIRSVGRWRVGDLPGAVAAANRAFEYAEEAGDRDELEEALGILDLAALSGPTPVDAALARCTEVLARPGLSRLARASALALIAALQSMRRDFDVARANVRESTQILEELGERVVVGYQSAAAAIVEQLAGDQEAAERELRRGYKAVEGFSQRSVRPYLAALLARVLYRQDRFDESDALTREAEEWGGSWDVSTEALWRATRAKLLARDGRIKDAEAQAQRALDLIAPTEFLNLHASILTDLAEVKLAGRHPMEALRLAQRALRMHEAKGNVAAADLIRRAMGRFASRVPL